MNSKNLHNHLLPVLIVSVSLLILGSSVALKIGRINLSDAVFTQSLTRSFINIKPSKNGFAEITFTVNNSSKSIQNTPVIKSKSVKNYSSIGKKVTSAEELSIVMNQTAADFRSTK
jgi:hypothetical protein